MSRETSYDPAYDDYTTEEYPPDWEGRRREVLDRDAHTCQSCGVKSTRVDDVYFDVDHVVPKSDGGGHQLSNLQALCPSCHAEKHAGNRTLARRAREWERRNTRSLFRRVLRIVLVVPVLFGLLSRDRDSRTITDEHGRELAVTPIGTVPDLSTDRGVTIDGRVATLWDDTSPSIQQVGLLAPADSTREDDVTLVKFVAWSGNDLPTMRSDQRYRVVGALTSEHEGDLELHLDGQTAIRALD